MAGESHIRRSIGRRTADCASAGGRGTNPQLRPPDELRGTRRRCQIRACFREERPNLVGAVGLLLPQPPDLLLELPDLLLHVTVVHGASGLCSPG
jgi:hypothetical protein